MSFEDEVIALLPLAAPLAEKVIIAWATELLNSGKNPAAELEALLDSADAVADAYEDAKFGPVKT
jgi:hypothetical protein